ncbi:DUF4982 domain-containing protein [Sinomicrobium kalidii]|uniref:glycoside hydrolase family 2 TIM barrel-domain containing protein n=1 Tax=Sinomicrobium kalidii TaxID=2900738 RepID=UPI001E2BCE11|nr:glycoside hydrolase family 2 TIM barrel-domain containing protein [Sinomicrobium kalidii]UGU15773.1 DUF4982 domain-containing protein [Sinomicrobium kalidii]
MKGTHRILYLVFILLCCGCNTEEKPARAVMDFNENWQFKPGDHPEAVKPQFDASAWRTLDLPHDWSIEGGFSKDHPARPEGGALPTGKGWYRKTFEMPEDWQNKSVRIEFDGIYRNSEVWINGHHLGKRPNGYISFGYDLSPHLNFGETPNVIAVKADNSPQPNSRWYTGSGIYRNVRLIATGKLYVQPWGTYITTPEVSEKSAKARLEVTVGNNSGKPGELKVISEVLDADNVVVVRSESSGEIASGATLVIHQDLLVENPVLWDVDHPYVYKVHTRIYNGNKQTDSYETPLGIRYFDFDAEKGFSLNGKPMKILGVCLHHDSGALGAAVHEDALRRKLTLLKNMGANAIRTAHNPHSPELLRLCDEMGFIIQDEAFDVWKKKKVKEDYHTGWDDWHKKDLEDLIKRDRNHPSVMMWSIGNEIREQFDSTGITITRELTDIVKSLDTTRPVTCALTENIPEKNYIYRSGALDLLGFNYKRGDYKNFPEWYPGEKIIASENVSGLATRGHYDMPSDSVMHWPEAYDAPFEGNEDHTVSAYDHVAAYWGTTHEEAWKTVKNLDFMAGLFIWTGFDYLGEPVPYPYPARSSYFGIIDLAGFPKDVYYMYQSEWTDKPVLHIFPHWNWEEGQEVDVWAYYNQADEVELYLNGESLGKRSKKNGELHVMWRVKYEPGTLKAVSRKNGRTVLEKEIHTAGKASGMELLPDRGRIKSNKKDLCFVTVNIMDKHGNPVPCAGNEVRFEVSGGGKIAGVDNGYQAGTESFKASKRKAFNGKCLVIVQSNGKKEDVILKARSEGLEMAEVKIEVD